MITRLMRRFAILAVLLGLFGAVGAVAPATATPIQSAPQSAFQVAPATDFGALAIPDWDISQNTVHSTAYRVSNSSNLQFYGTLQAKAYNGQNYCYQVQYLTPEGNWTVDGFRTGDHNIPEQPMTHCSNDPEPYQTWTILAGLSVRGIRFTNGVNTGTHCNTATSCRAMYYGG